MLTLWRRHTDTLRPASAKSAERLARAKRKERLKMVRALIYRLAKKVADATREKRQPFSPSPDDLNDGIEHVVYEYSNLVAAYQYMEANPAGGPIVILVLNAFLLDCRQLADFFQRGTGTRDIVMRHYSNQGPVHLPHCSHWRDAIDKQLAHLSFGRATNPRPGLTELQTRRDLFAELQAAFRAFLPAVQDQTHRGHFAAWLITRGNFVRASLP